MTPEDYAAIRAAAGLGPPPPIPLGERLRELRTEAMLTLAELSEICGQSGRTVIYNWETGHTVPEIEMQVFLADFFGTTLDYLAGRPGADRENHLLRTAKEQLAGRFVQEVSSGLSRVQRMALAWRLANEVCPQAFPLRRVAGQSGLKVTPLLDLISGKQEHVSEVCLARFAYALGLQVEILRGR